MLPASPRLKNSGVSTVVNQKLLNAPIRTREFWNHPRFQFAIGPARSRRHDAFPHENACTILRKFFARARFS
jgi:hypothetical protein